MIGSVRLLLAAVCWFACLCPLAVAQVAPTWKLGESWELTVEAFPRLRGWASGDDKGGDHAAEKQHAGQQFHMSVIILSTEKVDGHDCVRINFISGRERPDFVPLSRYEVLVDVQDGWVRKAFNFKNYHRLLVEQFGAARLLTTAPEGFPLEMLPAVKPFVANSDEPPDTVLTVSGGPGPGIRTAVLSSERGKELEIRQVWDQGAKWWRDYERRRKGHLELRARVVPRKRPMAVVRKPAWKAPPPPTDVRPATPANASFPPFVDETNDPLQADPRLQAKVNWKAQNPRIGHVLERLHQATGLTFSADGNIEDSAPVFASLTWANVPACTVMHLVADAPAVQGRWEKSGAGYVLIGQRSPGEWPRPDLHRPLVISASVLGVVVLLLSGVLLLRKRRQAQPASPQAGPKTT